MIVKEEETIIMEELRLLKTSLKSILQGLKEPETYVTSVPAGFFEVS